MKTDTKIHRLDIKARKAGSKIIRLDDVRNKPRVRRTVTGVFFVSRTPPIAGIPANI